MNFFFQIFFSSYFLIQAASAQVSSYAAERLVMHSDFNGIKTLLDKGFNINSRFERNSTFLTLAMEYRKYEIAKYLVERGADLNLQEDYLHYTPLMFATSETWRNDTMAEYLIQKGADINIIGGTRTALINTVGDMGKNANIKMFKELIEKGADIRLPIDNCCSSVFLVCCFRGTPEMLQILLDKNEDINQVNKLSYNGLMIALGNKNLETVNFLIKNGIDLKYINREKRMATSYMYKTHDTLVVPDGIDYGYTKKNILLYEIPYKNGKMDGLSKYYYKGGALRQSAEYLDDAICGFCRDYYKNGKIKSEMELDGDDNYVNDTYYKWNKKGEKFKYKTIVISHNWLIAGKIHMVSERSKVIKTRVG